MPHLGGNRCNWRLWRRPPRQSALPPLRIEQRKISTFAAIQFAAIHRDHAHTSAIDQVAVVVVVRLIVKACSIVYGASQRATGDQQQQTSLRSM